MVSAEIQEQLMGKAICTPWGQPHGHISVAPGIDCYDTPSHGGFHLSPDRVAEMPAMLREHKTLAGDGWYEEDCDWVFVVLSFPQHFDANHVEAARKSLKTYKPDIYSEFEEWEKANATDSR